MLGWDVEEGLRTYREGYARPRAREQFTAATNLYWLRVEKVKDPGPPPELPDILRD